MACGEIRTILISIIWDEPSIFGMNSSFFSMASSHEMPFQLYSEKPAVGSLMHACRMILHNILLRLCLDQGFCEGKRNGNAKGWWFNGPEWLDRLTFPFSFPFPFLSPNPWSKYGLGDWRIRHGKSLQQVIYCASSLFIVLVLGFTLLIRSTIEANYCTALLI